MIYKSLILTTVKYENKYLHEWIEHYRNLGISKLLLIDNNDTKGKYAENIYDVINKDDSFIEVINMKDMDIGYHNISKILKNIYNNYYSQYDFLCLFDCDEFLELNEKYDNNINNYLNEPWFNNNECIIIYQQNYTSNGLTYYDNRPLKERFTETTNFNINLKSIINCNLVKPNKFFIYIKNYIKTNSYCNNDGQYLYINLPFMGYDKYNCAKLNHYCVKSTEEYVEKCLKNKQYYFKYNSVNMYKKYNNGKISNEQLNYIIQYLPENK